MVARQVTSTGRRRPETLLDEIMRELSPARAPMTLVEPTTNKSSVMIDRCARPYFRCIAPFSTSDVDWSSVRQQRITNCPLPATMAALARLCPRRVRGMITLLEDQPYNSTLNGRPGSGPSVLRVKFEGANHSVTISPRLHFARPAAPHRVNPIPANVLFAKAADGGWMSYIEKAYVVFRGNNHYENLSMGRGNPPTLQRVFLDVVGRFDQIATAHATAARVLTANVTHVAENNDVIGEESIFTPKSFEAFLKRASQAPTIAGTWADPDVLVGSHTYVVLCKQGESVVVQEFMRGSAPVSIPIANFFREFDVVLQSRRATC